MYKNRNTDNIVYVKLLKNWWGYLLAVATIVILGVLGVYVMDMYPPTDYPISNILVGILVDIMSVLVIYVASSIIFLKWASPEEHGFSGDLIENTTTQIQSNTEQKGLILDNRDQTEIYNTVRLLMEKSPPDTVSVEQIKYLAQKGLMDRFHYTSLLDMMEERKRKIK